MQQDKIFDEDVKKYLIDLGMEEAQIENIRKKKLKEYAIFVLNEIIEAIKSNNFKSIQKYVRRSPSGDCMGSDNTFIDFGGITPCRLDIENLVKKLSDDSIKLT